MSHKFDEIISVDNLLLAWQEFIRGKRSKLDVQKFNRNLIDNILLLYNDLAKKTYQHGGYFEFNVSDPKPRRISKASVRDRLIHHAVHRILYPLFDKKFIFDSYSCRIKKGTHRAVRRLRSMFLEVSDYNHKTCWILKLDIKKFFASIDHNTLKQILATHIQDPDVLWLLENIINSFGVDYFVAFTPRNDNKDNFFASEAEQSYRKGLPLGNLTSQLLVNVYMNELDNYLKHKLKAKHYIRYADDCVIIHSSHEVLTTLLYSIGVFLKQRLKLTLHPNKIILKTYASGIDFLGWVNFSDHKVLRTATKRRINHRLIRTNMSIRSLQSYLRLLKYGQTYNIQEKILNNYWLFKD